MDKEVLTLDDLAAFLECPVPTAAGLIHSGQIPARKVGKSWKIHIDAARNWLLTGSAEPEKLKKKYRPRKETSQPEAQA